MDLQIWPSLINWMDGWNRNILSCTRNDLGLQIIFFSYPNLENLFNSKLLLAFPGYKGTPDCITKGSPVAPVHFENTASQNLFCVKK